FDDATFRTFFSGSPVKRIGRDRFLRNVLIAVGNSGGETYIPDCKALATDASPVVRGAAVWALFRLLDPRSFASLFKEMRDAETDPEVQMEWDFGLRHANE